LYGKLVDDQYVAKWLVLPEKKAQAVREVATTLIGKLTPEQCQKWYPNPRTLIEKGSNPLDEDEVSIDKQFQLMLEEYLTEDDRENIQELVNEVGWN
jgi:hypothetical protein